MTAPAEAETYVVGGTKPWNRRVFDEIICKYPGDWSYVERREDLAKAVESTRPRYTFFLHWSWIVPADVLSKTECVCFHMTDVPYGRGGSPLQNLIVRGHDRTKLTALRMVDELDAGPVYAKRDLDLHGTAEEIYVRAARLSAEMIGEIVKVQPDPDPQVGEPVVFARRRAEESEIPDLPSLDALFDFIRMLDADGYPRAFFEHRGFRYEFNRASRYDDRLVADVTITHVEDGA